MDKWEKNIIISSPKRVSEGDLAGSGMYSCEVYLPYSEKKHYPIYAGNPTEATNYADEFVVAYLQQKISRLENYLSAEDIRQKMLVEIEWARQELARHKSLRN